MEVVQGDIHAAGTAHLTNASRAATRTAAEVSRAAASSVGKAAVLNPASALHGLGPGQE
jgi:hypothetical protein